MNRFAELLDRLAYEPGRNNKLRLLTRYFREVEDPDRGYALAALTGALSFKHAKPGLIRDLIAAHPGKCPLLLCFLRPGGEVIFLETNERFNVMPSRQLQQEADRLFGEQTYYVKVDTSLPERAPRRWERRSEDGAAED